MDFASLVGELLNIINTLVIVVFVLTFVFMCWQIITGFIINGGDQYKTEEARKTIGFTFLMLFVMAAVWGLVALLRTTLMP